MYLDFYGFREKPFNLTPNTRFVFMSKTHREAFARLVYGINNHAGFIALTGEVGSGKTTMLRALLSHMDADHYRTALIFNPNISPSDLLQNINREFGIPSSPPGSANLLDALNSFLLQQNADGRTVVLVIDEAQKLEISVLEQIRLISNFETDSEKLIQIVLAGQPELGEMLKRKELRQLSQRITIRYHLQPMDLEDTREYINHRLEVAGAGDGVGFSGMAVKSIYRYSRGLPRLINAACDRALLAGYSKGASKITYRIGRGAITEIKKDTQSSKGRFALFPAFVIILLIVVAAGFYMRGQKLLYHSVGEFPDAKHEGKVPAGQSPFTFSSDPILRPVPAQKSPAPELPSRSVSRDDLPRGTAGLSRTADPQLLEAKGISGGAEPSRGLQENPKEAKPETGAVRSGLPQINEQRALEPAPPKVRSGISSLKNEKSARFLEKIIITKKETSTGVTILCDGQVGLFTSFYIRQPSRWVLDLMGIQIDRSLTRTREVGTPQIRALRIGKHGEKTRIVFDMVEENFPKPQAMRMGRSIRIIFGQNP